MVSTAAILRAPRRDGTSAGARARAPRRHLPVGASAADHHGRPPRNGQERGRGGTGARLRGAPGSTWRLCRPDRGGALARGHRATSRRGSRPMSSPRRSPLRPCGRTNGDRGRRQRGRAGARAVAALAGRRGVPLRFVETSARTRSSTAHASRRAVATSTAFGRHGTTSCAGARSTVDKNERLVLDTCAPLRGLHRRRRSLRLGVSPAPCASPRWREGAPPAGESAVRAAPPPGAAVIYAKRKRRRRLDRPLPRSSSSRRAARACARRPRRRPGRSPGRGRRRWCTP